MQTAWHFKTFTSAEITLFKRLAEEKNELFSYNNMNTNYQTRWIGTPVELCFKDYLDVHSIEHTYRVEEKLKDDLDFTVAQFLMDVKGVSCKDVPKENYACNLYLKQWEKIKRLQLINALVFGRFILPTNTAVVFGWLPVNEYEQVAEFIPKGSKRGIITTDTDMYEVRINQLLPLSAIAERISFPFSTPSRYSFFRS